MTDLPIVLVVEDEVESRETLKELLELNGYRVQTAADGQQALDQLDEVSMAGCVVLLDLFMPVMSGWDVIERLRSEGRLATTKLVITTSAPHSAPAGIPVCEKPLDLKKLLRAITAAVRSP